jgi:hypothetical protein
MKRGDLVKTPNGMGIFFDPVKEDPDKAYVRLKDPTEDKIHIPLIEPGHPVWECFPCDKFHISDLIVEKTFEERQREAQEIAMRAKAQRDALLQQKMREFQEQQRAAHERQQNKS